MSRNIDASRVFFCVQVAFDSFAQFELLMGRNLVEVLLVSLRERGPPRGWGREAKETLSMRADTSAMSGNSSFVGGSIFFGRPGRFGSIVPRFGFPIALNRLVNLMMKQRAAPPHLQYPRNNCPKSPKYRIKPTTTSSIKSIKSTNTTRLGPSPVPTSDDRAT